MNTIAITIDSAEFEQMTIELSREEVTSLYKLRKENQATIATLTKEVETQTKYYKQASNTRDDHQKEIAEANTLLTALGVPDKTSEEEVYYRKTLSLVTRIALYIATKK